MCRYSSSADAVHMRTAGAPGAMDPDVAAVGVANDEPIPFLVVHRREVVPLPVANGSGAVQAEDKDDLLVGLQIAGVIQKELATCSRLDGIALVSLRSAPVHSPLQWSGGGVSQTTPAMVLPGAAQADEAGIPPREAITIADRFTKWRTVLMSRNPPCRAADVSVLNPSVMRAAPARFDVFLSHPKEPAPVPFWVRDYAKEGRRLRRVRRLGNCSRHCGGRTGRRPSGRGRDEGGHGRDGRPASADG